MERFTKLKVRRNEDGRYLAPVDTTITREEIQCYYPETGEKRKIVMEFHPRDDEWAGDTAARFLKEYVKRYAYYMRKDDHHYDTNMSIPDDIIGFPYTICRDAETGAVLGFYAKLCRPRKYKGKEAMLLEGHAMCALPGIGARELVNVERGSDSNTFTNAHPARKGDEDLINVGSSGLGGRGLKSVDGNKGLGTLLALFDWNHAKDYYDHPMLYSLDTANEASAYVLCNKFGTGENWHETGSYRTTKKGQRCQIKIERLFHPEFWQ